MDARTKYNTLVKFERIPGKLNRSRKIYPVHKALKPIISEDENFGTDISEYILKYVELKDNDRILDAGCGNGHTLSVLLKDSNRKGTGISISNEEINTARKNFKTTSLKDQTEFICQSYDDPVSNKAYDIIIAIESLKHSRDIGNTLRNLSSGLVKRGKIIIVEDLFLNEENGKAKNFIFLKKQWALERLYTLQNYDDTLKSLGFRQLHNINLTDRVNHRSRRKLQKKICRFRFIRPFIIIPQWKKLLDIFLAGYIYEDLYASGKLEYYLLIYQKS